MKTLVPYGRKQFTLNLPDEACANVIDGGLDSYVPDLGEEDLVKYSLANPIGSKKLSELSVGKKKIVIISSDHTRPVPSRIIMPLLLEEIRRGNPEADITILIATGCHRETTREELEAKFGTKIVSEEKIDVHNSFDENELTVIGTLPSGGMLKINKLAAEADLLIAEGFIEPHFFAGFSGGRKAVLPGIAAARTVYWNHNADFIHSDKARTGILEGNPIHEDMVAAARTAKLAFICNVVINSEHRIIGAFSGDMEEAHLEGVAFLRSLCEAKVEKTDIVITTNNGYPLDQNLYQSVKGVCTAEGACKEGGYIILSAECEDGIGGESFARTFMNEKTPAEILQELENTPKADTIADQWQSQIYARALSKHKVIAITGLDDDIIRAMKLIPAHSLEEALTIAGYDGKNPKAKTITIIPQGISAIIH